MLQAPPQPVVLATSVASYLAAPAAGRRVTAWLEYPASHAGSPDAVARRKANRLVIADRAGRRAQVVYDGGCAALQRCDTVAAPQAGADTVLYAVADGQHADLASATLQPRPGRLVAQMVQPKGGPPPFALAGPEAVWYTAGHVRRRPPDLKERATTLVAVPIGGSVRAVVRHEPVTAWVARTSAGQDAVFEQLDGGRPPPALPRDAAGRAADLSGATRRRPRRRRGSPHGGRRADRGECAVADARSRAAGGARGVGAFPRPRNEIKTHRFLKLWPEPGVPPACRFRTRARRPDRRDRRPARH